MADDDLKDLKFDVPTADDIAQAIKNDLETRVNNISKTVRSTLEEAKKPEDWPVRLPLEGIDEDLRDPLYTYLTTEGKYKIMRYNEYWSVDRPS